MSNRANELVLEDLNIEGIKIKGKVINYMNQRMG